MTPALFIPIPSPDPVSIAITVASAVLTVFGLFRGGGLKDVMRGLNGLRGELSRIADSLMRFAWRIARTLGRVLQALHTLWVRILEPALAHIARIAARVNQIVDRILRPYLEALRRIREAIDLLYNVIFRPILAPLETLRKILAIGRILRIGAARRLDDRIVRLEGKILEPIRALYAKVNEVGGWLNVLTDARAVLQRAVLLNSLYAYQGAVVDLLYNAQTPDPDPEGVERLRRAATPDDERTITDNFRQFVLADSGPYAARGRDLAAGFRRLNPLAG